MRDRRRYLHWIFEAKKRFGLSVLNYMVTSNHIHLLVKDTGQDVIAQSMQLIAGRTAQEYNERKGRRGVFLKARYHATRLRPTSICIAVWSTLI
jgi:REP element-mobilizing transposase RayT